MQYDKKFNLVLVQEPIGYYKQSQGLNWTFLADRQRIVKLKLLQGIL